MKVRGPDGRKVKLQDNANVAGFVIDKRLTSQMLSRVNFEGATLNGNAFWKGENDGIGSFYECNFRDAKISIQGDITYTNCFQIDFNGSCFDGAILTNIHFGTCDFRDVSFKGADLWKRGHQPVVRSSVTEDPYADRSQQCTFLLFFSASLPFSRPVACSASAAGH